jgi:hypothetical protein
LQCTSETSRASCCCPGGTHTVLKRKGEKPEFTTGLIRPMPPTELLPRGRNDPVVIMEQYEDKQKKKSLRIRKDIH